MLNIQYTNNEQTIVEQTIKIHWFLIPWVAGNIINVEFTSNASEVLLF